MGFLQLWFDFINAVEQWDKSFFLELNGFHSTFWDAMMFWISDKYVWIPLYISLLFVIIKNKQTETILITVGVILTIVLSDQFASSLCKPLFERLRPAQDPSLMDLTHVVAGNHGDLYGFISSHAANTFGLAVYTTLLFKNKGYACLIFLWACLNSYSRIYLGLHFPLDICFGALAGSLFAVASYQVYLFLKRVMPQYNFSLHKTNSRLNRDFPTKDFKVVYLTLATTFFFIIVFAVKNPF